MLKKYGLLIVLVGGFLILALFTTPVRAEVAPRRIEVTAKRFAFEPGDITLKKGQPVVIVLKSVDVPHGLRFRDLNVAVKVAAGGTATVQFTPQKTGNYVGHCYVFCGSGHGSMALTMHIIE